MKPTETKNEKGETMKSNDTKTSVEKEYLYLEPAPDGDPDAVPRVHVWLNWSPDRVARDHSTLGMCGPAFTAWYVRYEGVSEDQELRWFEGAINLDIARLSKSEPVVLYLTEISKLHPATRAFLRKFIREADAPDAPWRPVVRQRVHVVVNGTRAELEELLL